VIWRVHPVTDEARRIAKHSQVHPIVASILTRRGLNSAEDVQKFLDPRLENLESPYAFQDMVKAVERIQSAIRKKEKILIFGDYDVDGVTASAILYPVLRSMGADVEVHIPHRLHEGYGLNRASIEPWVLRSIGLVITVDNGITGVEAVKFLNSHHIDVVIVDHHVPKDEVPPAYAFISSAVGDQKGDPNLAACGLAFKLAWALLGDLEKVLPYLDIVTLGTIADLAPVQGDNRILLKHGLNYLARTQRVGLKALMQEARIKPQYIGYRDIAFGLGPRINASGRMGSPLNAFKLLTTDNVVEARNLAQILEEGNRDRQKVEASAYLAAAKQVEERAEFHDQPVLVVNSPDWHEGILGIVASRLVERFKKPAIVISTRSGVGKGSGRSLPGFSIFKNVLECEDLLANFGGHAQACGLSIKPENIEPFRRSLNEAARRLLSGSSADEDVWVDADIQASELSGSLLKDLERLEPFGPGHAKPLFVTRQMRVRGDVKKRGKDTLQCWMTDADDKVTCEVIGFRSYERWLANDHQQKIFDIIYQPTLQNFNGIQTITLQMESWQ
jgi:single-stranded-DNA-specific exonuclease